MSSNAKTPTETVRYAVVGGGEISQTAFMPGISATSNSRLVALVTGDPKKAEALGERYGIKSYTYDDYDQLLDSGEVDAVYVATPNFRHREHTVPALEAGIHVLLEKPMATSVEDCEAMIKAAEKSGAKLMVAYRLHHEPGTVEMITRLQQGELGRLHSFTSHFSQDLNEQNHRATNGYWAGVVPDQGTYQINAVRHLFGAEPVAVRAAGRKHPEREYNFDDTVSITLEFEGGQLATFLVSCSAAGIDRFTLVAEKGTIDCDPSFVFGPDVSIKSVWTDTDGNTQTLDPGAVEQFGGQTEYFSNCILTGKDPEADGEEGRRDLRILEAIERALETGERVTLEPLEYRPRITTDQIYRLTPVEPPEPVSVQSISG
ncbi:Gfo/Idh/MocA family protein [Larsenimonas suaedae]|uniref:Gfo/Idh/MocA family oxidoreductase n=1 Tax=Larsenimonas suaedae TaxID=1851019 RepID=A0ABU1GRE0_9GAMM|nr:Gfo/Idh/MocA family oxidoreductase [Larsenimonas suaedae]MCM2972633.1 Gfo/Idh/MocA family oxidoreductase [Larsenimonas suaedae]MDR5894570.1 Gfo/Idh/MocA family oxidoreductase [Larsenimonas suaedae]